MLTILRRVKSLCQAVMTKQLEFFLPTKATAGKYSYVFSGNFPVQCDLASYSLIFIIYLF